MNFLDSFLLIDTEFTFYLHFQNMYDDHNFCWFYLTTKLFVCFLHWTNMHAENVKKILLHIGSTFNNLVQKSEHQIHINGKNENIVLKQEKWKSCKISMCINNTEHDALPEQVQIPPPWHHVVLVPCSADITECCVLCCSSVAARPEAQLQILPFSSG